MFNFVPVINFLLSVLLWVIVGLMLLLLVGAVLRVVLPVIAVAAYVIWGILIATYLVATPVVIFQEIFNPAAREGFGFMALAALAVGWVCILVGTWRWLKRLGPPAGWVHRT